MRLSQPAICSGDHCRRSRVDTGRLKNGRQASLQSLGRRTRSGVGGPAGHRAGFGGRASERDHAIATYQANVAAVLAEVLPGRLLVHRLGDGWAPLCTHLGVPVPDVPYPHSNTSATFEARMHE